MKITVFTSNQPRHIAFIESLTTTADEVFAVQECTTVFPGKVPDFYQHSAIMQTYFTRVVEAEEKVFGHIRLLPKNIRCLVLKMGDLNFLDERIYAPLLRADALVVFGASFIKGTLCDELIKRKTLNLHIGVSPFYRGNSTNFWALYDKQPQFVGATIHLLTKGLDSGPILQHAFPKAAVYDPFELGMRAVQSGQSALIDLLTKRRTLPQPVKQDKTLERRHTRKDDFTDDVAREYLANLLTPRFIHQALQQKNLQQFINPYVGP